MKTNVRDGLWTKDDAFEFWETHSNSPSTSGAKVTHLRKGLQGPGREYECAKFPIQVTVRQDGWVWPVMT